MTKIMNCPYCGHGETRLALSINQVICDFCAARGPGGSGGVSAKDAWNSLAISIDQIKRDLRQAVEFVDMLQSERQNGVCKEICGIPVDEAFDILLKEKRKRDDQPLQST